MRRSLTLLVVLAIAAAAVSRQPASANEIERHIADFWKRVDALAPSDLLTAADLGLWAINVIERDPGAGIKVADFRASTTRMQSAFDRAAVGVAPGQPNSADIEDRIARFWAKVDALGNDGILSATDLGQWALNVTDRDPNKRIYVDDFRASTADMQAGFERAQSLPRPAPPAPVATVSVTPTTATVLTGRTQRFTAAVRDAARRTLGTPVRWSVEPAGLGTIDIGGNFTGAIPGNGVVRASAGGVSVTVPLAVAQPVTVAARQLVMPSSQFQGYEVPRDEAWGTLGWFREFSNGPDYWWLQFYVAVLSASTDVAARVTSTKCDGSFNTPHDRVRMVAVPSAGIAALGCLYEWDTQFGPWLHYATATRNVYIQVGGRARSTVTESQLIDRFVDLARRQIALIDQQAPAGAASPSPSPSPTPAASGSRISFTAPAQLPNATVGVEYEYSFCQPRPTTRTTACGPFPATTNPTGGQPPYHFQLGSGVGFPPIGCSLLKDGHLWCQRGPSPGSEGGTSTFVVCAVDLAGDQTCVTVTIFVTGAPTPTPTQTPTPTPTPDQTPYELTLTSKQCTPTTILSNGFNVTRYSVVLSGTASGPVGTYVTASTCSGWTLEAGSCRRREGDPPSTTWTLSSPASQDVHRANTVYEASLKHIDLNLRDRGLEKRVSYSCP